MIVRGTVLDIRADRQIQNERERKERSRETQVTCRSSRRGAQDYKEHSRH